MSAGYSQNHPELAKDGSDLPQKREVKNYFVISLKTGRLRFNLPQNREVKVGYFG